MGEENEGKKCSKGKEKAMSVRLEQYGILVVSHRSEKPHMHTRKHTNTRLFPPLACSHLYGVSVVLAAALAHTHTHTLK